MLIFTTAFVFVANAPVAGPRWFSRDGVGLLSPLSIGPPPSQFLALRGMEGYALTRGTLGTLPRLPTKDAPLLAPLGIPKGLPGRFGFGRGGGGRVGGEGKQ